MKLQSSIRALCIIASASTPVLPMHNDPFSGLPMQHPMRQPMQHVELQYVEHPRLSQEIKNIRLSQEIKQNPCLPETQSLFYKGMAECRGCMSNHRGGAYILNELPNSYFKKGADRLVGAKIMRDVITKKNLNLLLVPDKCICTYNDRTWIAAKKISNASSNPLNLDQTKQLCTLILKTWVWDLPGRNIVKTNNGQVAIIDTELSGFKKNKSDRIGGLYVLSKGNYFDKDAKKYLKQQIKDENIRLDINEWFEQKLADEQSFDLLKLHKQSRKRNYDEMRK